MQSGSWGSGWLRLFWKASCCRCSIKRLACWRSASRSSAVCLLQHTQPVWHCRAASDPPGVGDGRRRSHSSPALPRAQWQDPAPQGMQLGGAARGAAGSYPWAQPCYLHLVRRFWNQVLTWASVILRALARVARSAEARYFWR